MIAAVSNAQTDCTGRLFVKGNGFCLTEHDVQMVKEYYSKSPIRVKEAEFHRVALKLKLFAHEAVVEHLDKGIAVPSQGVVSAEYWGELANAYYKSVVDSYPISDLDIESYVRAFPWRFEKDADRVSGASTPVPVLTPELKQKVRYIIISAKSERIISETEDRLKKKYDIQWVSR